MSMWLFVMWHKHVTCVSACNEEATERVYRNRVVQFGILEQSVTQQANYKLQATGEKAWNPSL